MKAVLCKQPGPPSSLVVENIASPQPGPGQLVVTMQAAGVNFPDVLIIQGKYQHKPEMPFSPGAEASGIVKAVGPGVTGFSVGDAVAAVMTYGAFAEEIVVDAARAIKLPARFDMKVAACFGLTYGTSYHALKDRARIRPGETMLVLGAAGGVGLAAVELGALMGARVIAAASSEEKLATCRRFGAAHTINYAEEDLREALRKIVGNDGVDVVYDPVGDKYAEPAVRSLAWGGRFLVVGFAAGEIPKIPLNLLLLKGASIVGVFWGNFSQREAAANANNNATLVRWIASGHLKPLISATYRLDQVPAALTDMSNRKVQGKVVVVP
ncbi:MAG: NADPH:quinone oxidoreductase family protein [Betaproteobacteria bacterium]|nr:NADPH:quinone oxidoreductase family protein [Betaproteobacteria bacterium]